MAETKVDSRGLGGGWQGSSVKIEPTRARQTEERHGAFEQVLAASNVVLMSGAQIVTRVLGVPGLAAAVQPGLGAASGATAPTVAAGGELGTMQAMQRESQAFNLQLLELQEQVQQENRRFTTLSNVLRAKHDTAKAAVSNIRS
jgi:hypothetical protein